MGFKLSQLFLLAAFKYFLTIPYALLIEIEYKYALPTIVLGGIGGFFFFYFLSKKVVRLSKKLLPLVCRLIPGGFKPRFGRICDSLFKPKPKPVFSFRNRMIVRVKKSYGLWGIVITTPVLLSIPVGAFLASHYYSKDKKVIIYMVISIIGWGAIFSLVPLLFPGIF